MCVCVAKNSGRVCVGFPYPKTRIHRSPVMTTLIRLNFCGKWSNPLSPLLDQSSYLGELFAMMAPPFPYLSIATRQTDGRENPTHFQLVFNGPTFCPTGCQGGVRELLKGGRNIFFVTNTFMEIFCYIVQHFAKFSLGSPKLQ